MKNKQIKVFAPASIGNVGPGFDILGAAISEPGDIIIAEKTEEPGLQFSMHGGNFDLPPSSVNVAAHVARTMMNELHLSFGIRMKLHKNMPVGSGLGSSGASSAAAAFAVNTFLDVPLPKEELIRFAMEGERLATGAPHADNVAPSLLGGICLIRSYSPLDVIKLQYKNIFYWVVVHPQLIIHTKTARELLPHQIPLSIAIEQTGNLAALITGLIHGDASVIASALNDSIAEPVRAPLIPGYYDIKRAAIRAGAIGFSISGSGPSVFALARNPEEANQIAKVITQAFAKFSKVECDIYISRINDQGACLVGDDE